MLAHFGRRGIQHAGLVRELDRDAKVRAAVGAGDPHLARNHLFAHQTLAHALDRGPAAIDLRQIVLPVRARARGECFGEKRAHRVVRASRRRLAGFDQVGATQRGQQVGDELDLATAQCQELAIGAAVDVVEGVAAESALFAGDEFAILDEHGTDDIGHPGDEAVVHADIDVVARAGARAAQQRHQDARERHQRGCHVGRGHTGNHRCAVAAAIHADQAAFGFDAHVVRHPFHVGPGLTIRGDRAVNDARIHRGDRLVPDAEPVDHAGAKRFEHHIGAFGQLQKGVDRAGLLEVQHHALLVAMRAAEVDAGAVLVLRADFAIGLATGRLDADHLGAMVGHHHGQMRAGQEIGQVENADAFEFHDA